MRDLWKIFTLMICIILVTNCSGGQPTPPPSNNDIQFATPTALMIAMATPISATETVITQTVAAEFTPVVTFKISGGIVGFCDELYIGEKGEFKINQPCKNHTLTGNLVGVDLTSFQSWRQELAEFQLMSEPQTGADIMQTELLFKGNGATTPDESQKGVIADWVNGLIARMQPPPPTPAPPPTVAVGPEGLCPTISRPAMLVDNYDSPYKIMAIDPTTLASCDIILPQPPLGRIVTAQGSLFFPVFNETEKSVMVWQLPLNGQPQPLIFTRVVVEQPFYPFNFAISADGRKIAWAQTVIEASNNNSKPPYHNNLWVANLDGSEQVALMQQVTNNEARYVIPIRFAPDNSTLYYAMQPNGLGGGPYSFVGKYDTLYQLALTGGEGQLIYACQSAELVNLCIGDISSDGRLVAYTDTGAQTITIIQQDGTVINSFTGPGKNYLGQPMFAPNGNLAFISITFNSDTANDQPPTPNPGYISFVAPPYTNEPQTLLADNSVLTVWEWLNDSQVAYGLANQEHFSPGVGLVSLEVQTTTLSTNFPLGVWR